MIAEVLTITSGELLALGTVALMAFLLLALCSATAAYHNGVTDGFGFSVEPHNRGYAKAGKYLREHMAYRWPELRYTDDDEADD